MSQISAVERMHQLLHLPADLDAPTWREQVDRDGKLIREGLPSSSLYHLFLAVAEAIRVLPGAKAG